MYYLAEGGITRKEHRILQWGFFVGLLVNAILIF